MKLFKFWKYRIEIKLSKIPNDKKIEFLANRLIKELNFKINKEFQGIDINIFDKEKLAVSRLNESKNAFIEIACKYTGK